MFEWNEDHEYGPHFHILKNGKHIGNHYKAGMLVPVEETIKYF